MRRRRNPELGFSVKDLTILAAIGGAVYLLYPLISSLFGAAKTAGKAATAGYNAAVNWTSDLFTSWFGSDPTGTSVYHIVTFLDDGSRHAVGANLVNSSGVFQWTGYPPGTLQAVAYQLGQDGAGGWVASPVVPTVMGALP